MRLFEMECDHSRLYKERGQPSHPNTSSPAAQFRATIQSVGDIADHAWSPPSLRPCRTRSANVGSSGPAKGRHQPTISSSWLHS